MRVLIFVCAALLAFADPCFSQSADSQPSGTIEIENDLRQDAATLQRISSILEQLDGYEGVQVSVVNGVVGLRGEVLTPEAIEELNIIASRISGVVAIENSVVATTLVLDRLEPAVDRLRARLEALIAFAPLALVAAFAGALVMWFGFWIASRAWPWNRIAPNSFIADLYRQITRLIFVVMGIILTLDLLNATALLGTILGAAGIVGLAIGFAVRDTVENFISSIMLSIRQPFRPKDLVMIDGELGHVIRLTSRATILLSLDGNHVRLPNSSVFKAKIINYTRNEERRFTFALGVDPSADIAQAQTIILSALERLPFVLDSPAPAVWVEQLGASTTDISAAGWINQRETSIGMAKGEAIRTVKAALESAGITLPEPTYRLLGANPPISPSQPTPPAGRDSEPAGPVQVSSVAANETEDLEQLIEEEREALCHDDLLRDDAPQE